MSQQASQSAAELAGVLQSIAHHYGPWDVVRKFLELSHVVFDELPANLRAVAAKQPMPVTDVWGKATAGMHPEHLSKFARGLGILLEASTDASGRYTYADVIGSAYMQMGAANTWAGQYFTPQSVADCMAQMCAHDDLVEDEFRRRLVDTRHTRIRPPGPRRVILPGGNT